MMFPTVEVRWFYRGNIPGEVKAWFQGAGEEVEAQPSRVDAYLRLPENDSLGVKVREGRLEIKQRQEVYGVHRFQAGVGGVVEGWRKWGFPLGDMENKPPWLPGNEDAWIEVHKKRWMRIYTMEGGQVRETAVGDYLTNGCGWELAEVGVIGVERNWWSVGFEAFGDEEGLKDILHAVVGHVIEMGKSPNLEVGNSFGYPGWMAQWSVTSRRYMNLYS